MKHIDPKTDYKNFEIHKNNNIASSFFKDIEFIEREMKKLLRHPNYLDDSSETLDLLKTRSIKMIKMNFHYILSLLNNFKLDPLKKSHFLLIKINLIKLFINVVEEFKIMRKDDPDFFYFSLDEENRYVYGIRRCFLADAECFLPSKLAFLFVRHVRYYVYKIKKYFLKNQKEKHKWKCAFYVNSF
jgi:hypothetical protein